MDVRCENCTHLFWVDGQAGGLVQCPNCGEAFARTPSGVGDEMELRDMPNQGPWNDTGGNPLQEGVLGDWQNREVRDESFPGRQGKEAALDWEPGLVGKGGIDEQGNMHTWNAKSNPPTVPFSEGFIIGADGTLLGVTDPRTIEQVRATDPRITIRHDQSARKLTHVEWQHFGHETGEVDEASAKTADWDDEDIDFSLGFEDFDAGPSTQTATHKFIVTPGNRVLSAPEPTTHEAIAEVNGQGEKLLKGSSLGQLYGDGTTKWFQHASGLNPDELQDIVGNHFGMPVQIDPNLKPSSNEDRWGLMTRPRGRELDVLHGPAKPRFGPRQPIPGEAEGLLRGGASIQPFTVSGNDFMNAFDVHDSWYEYEAPKLAAGPGEVEAIPSQHGLHNDVVRALTELGVTVNGRPVDRAYGGELIKHYSPLGQMMDPSSQWEQNKGKPVIVGHEDPALVDVAKQVIESGSYRPVAEHHQAVNSAHSGPATTNPEVGFSKDVVQALGFLDVYVDGRRLRDYYRQIAQANPGQVTLGASDPEKLAVAQQVLQQGSKEPALAYQAQRQARTSAFLAPAALAGGRFLGGALVGQLMGGAMNPGAGLSIPGFGGGMGMGLGQLIPGMGGDQQQMPPPQEQVPVRGLEQLAAEESFDHPNTMSEIPGASTNDPEAIDPHEMNDGAQYEPGQFYEPGIDEPGANQLGPDEDLNPDAVDPNDFDPNGPAMERFRMLLPLVQYYYENEETGAHDPLIQGLHQTLEMERPGYLDAVTAKTAADYPYDGGDGDRLARESVTALPGTIPGIEDMAQSSPTANPAMNSPTMPNAQQNQQAPGLSLCPHCNAPLAGNGTCPTCGYGGDGTQGQPRTLQPQLQQTQQPGAMMPYARTAGAGPKTQEQFQAVGEFLEQEGRGDEIPYMVQHPDEYVEELAQVQEVVEEAPPPVEQPAPPGGMAPPMPPPGGPPGLAPGPGPQMMAAVARYAADSVAPRCPECESHTTSLLNNNGDCRCTNCGNMWVAEDLIPSNPNPPKVAADDVMAPEDHRDESFKPSERPNVVEAPAAERERPRDLERENDPSLSWQDVDGQPLETGKTYELHERRFVIPDIVQVTDIGPDEITYIPQGTYNLGKERTLKREDRELYGTEFVPVALDNEEGDVQDEAPPEQRAKHPDPEPGQTDDLSSPTIRSHVVNDIPLGGSHQHLDPKVAAPPAGSADPSGEKVCQTCKTAQHVVTDMLSASEYHHNCYRCGGEWSSLTSPVADVMTMADERAWLYGGSPPSATGIDPMAAMGLPDMPPQAGTAAGGSRDIRRMAGKNYDAFEQRDLIDEPGTARNIGKLDLRGTHYESRADFDPLFLGMAGVG